MRRWWDQRSLGAIEHNGYFVSLLDKSFTVSVTVNSNDGKTICVARDWLLLKACWRWKCVCCLSLLEVQIFTHEVVVTSAKARNVMKCRTQGTTQVKQPTEEMTMRVSCDESLLRHSLTFITQNTHWRSNASRSSLRSPVFLLHKRSDARMILPLVLLVHPPLQSFCLSHLLCNFLQLNPDLRDAVSMFLFLFFYIWQWTLRDVDNDHDLWLFSKLMMIRLPKMIRCKIWGEDSLLFKWKYLTNLAIYSYLLCSRRIPTSNISYICEKRGNLWIDVEQRESGLLLLSLKYQIPSWLKCLDEHLKHEITSPQCLLDSHRWFSDHHQASHIILLKIFKDSIYKISMRMCVYSVLHFQTLIHNKVLAYIYFVPKNWCLYTTQ